MDLANLVSQGERWTLAARWSAERPLFVGQLRLPSTGRLKGVTQFAFAWERQTYAMGTDVTQSRRMVALSLSDWRSSRTFWRVTGGVDRVDRDGYVVFGGEMDQRVLDDRVSVHAETQGWARSRARFAANAVGLSWRSSSRPDTRNVAAAVNWRVVTDTAPLAVWPGASTGQGRDLLLRAHPLLTDGRVTGPAFGRSIAHATVELEQPLTIPIPIRVAIAAFTDAARVSSGPHAGGALVDSGVGLRIRTGVWDGVLRIDVARSWQDRGTVVSAGWLLPWPALRSDSR